MFSFQIFVGSRRELVANSIHTADVDATQLVTGAENWKLGHDWRLVRSHRQLSNSTSLSANCSDSSILVETVAN